MPAINTGSATWEGDLKSGKGTISTKSGALSSQPYGFNTRFEGKPGTNPEELVGAAHASCFAMAMSLFLGNEGFTAEHMDAKSDVALEQEGEGFAVKKIHLTLKAKIPNIEEATFQKIAEATKEGCPISKLLNAKITLDASLV
ncbi:osmotically inducible, stress-inducible membrane protein [Beijerinckiaceae bacterium RH AL1]|nr:OsmC family protein [Beijerinckiaceae bacterium]VVB44055.1 osmotically inducible, stress-inducible membrane protein [Beijerinckiaceae bacterium RH CH11]VVB44082.1 osmotically inducible, stress-inducible membrane protein [Beijerinckiaceae bacterium RH AL8]VVC54148.1 osmotically inducible, stress-inducible membrane protein [Beijerinckiaceae bacterium RH AL1]